MQCVIVGGDGYDLVAKPVEELERRVSLVVLHKNWFSKKTSLFEFSGKPRLFV